MLSLTLTPSLTLPLIPFLSLSLSLFLSQLPSSPSLSHPSALTILSLSNQPHSHIVPLMTYSDKNRNYYLFTQFRRSTANEKKPSVMFYFDIYFSFYWIFSHIILSFAVLFLVHFNREIREHAIRIIDYKVNTLFVILQYRLYFFIPYR